MNSLKRTFSIMVVLMMLALPLAVLGATPNPSPASTGYMILPFHVTGQYTTTTAGVIKFNVPFPVRLITFMATARASGGTTPTLTVDLKVGGSSVLSTPVSITAGTVSEGTISTPAVADEAAVTVDFTIGGGTPTWNDMTIIIVCKRQ